MVVECVNWDRTLLRLGISFLFNLVMAVWKSPSERCGVLIDAITKNYQDTFTQEELVRIATIFEAYAEWARITHRRLTQYLDMAQFIMCFMDVMSIINNTNTKDALLVYELGFLFVWQRCGENGHVRWGCFCLPIAGVDSSRFNSSLFLFFPCVVPKEKRCSVVIIVTIDS